MMPSAFFVSQEGVLKQLGIRSVPLALLDNSHNMNETTHPDITKATAIA